MASPEDRDGTELHLERNDNPAAKAYQEALFEQGQPAVMFYSDDVNRDFERMKNSAEFRMPPTKVTGSTIAQVNGGFSPVSAAVSRIHGTRRIHEDTGGHEEDPIRVREEPREHHRT